MNLTFKRIFSCILAAVLLAGCANDSSYSDQSGSFYDSSDSEFSYFDSDSGDIESEPSESSSAPEPGGEPIENPPDNPQEEPPEEPSKLYSEPEYLEFFKKPAVHVLNLEMENWTYFINHPFAKTYMSVDVVIDGERYENSAIKTRGNSSLYAYAVSEDGTIRPPFKIKFDKYVDDRTFKGLDELVLLSASDDRAFIRDYLGYAAFRAIGGDAPAVTFFNIYANGELHGLYVGVEAIDKSFLDRVFNSHKHSLYKAGSQATLLPSMSLSIMEQKKGSDESKNDLKYLIQTLNGMTLGEKGNIEDILNVDSVLKYFAVNAVMYNWDDYSGVYCHNYYLYMNDGVFYFLPWDMNMCCEQWGPHYEESAGSRTDIELPITNGAVLSQRPLVEKLLSIEEYYNQYLDYCYELNEWLKEIDGSSYLNNLWETIKIHVKNDPTKFYEYWRVEYEYNKNAFYGIAYFIHDRTVYLTKRLEQLRPSVSAE